MNIHQENNFDLILMTTYIPSYKTLFAFKFLLTHLSLRAKSNKTDAKEVSYEGSAN